MDKKYLTNRSLVPGNQSVDNARKNDGGRYGRGRGRREGTNGKSDPTKPVLPQKSKAFTDKWPKPRGVGLDRTKEEIVDERENLGYTHDDRPRKVNLSHLLNFSYAPRGDQTVDRWGRRVHAPSRVKFNKEQFLQANCQFVVKDNFDYTAHNSDPDTLVNWEQIELIRMATSEQPSCPICLYPPTPAKMTRCGHIYCWSCILHYLSLDDRPWRKCPICYEAVHPNHLKSVKTYTVKDYHIGDTITMRLMKKQKGSIIVSPVPDPRTDEHVGDEEEGASCAALPSDQLVSNDGAVALYQKLMLASSDEVMDTILRTERDVLSHLLATNTEESEVCFIESALAHLQDREASLQAPPPSALVPPQEANGVESMNNACTADEKFFYFYQASDGQQIYINSTNARSLMSEYEGLENGPLTISADVVEVEYHVMTKELRKRLRYLNHLPVTCEFKTVELHLKPPILSPATLAIFHDEIEKRRRDRRKKSRDESRHRRKVQQEEDRKQGIYPAMTAKLDSRKQFPEYSPSILIGGGEDSGRSSPASVATVSSCGSPYGSPRSDPFAAYRAAAEDGLMEESEDVRLCQSVSPTGPSFAQMLKEGTTRPTAWPTVMNPPLLSPISPSPGTTPASDPEDSTPVPSFKTSFGHAFQTALENFTIKEESTGGRKKKKKQKNKVLFSTSINRSMDN